ncbi:hypothetical protein TWF281_002755 [Arthrobotrys megalospora]
MPPKVSRPRVTGGHLNTKLLEAAFDIQYYRERTGSWKDIKMGPALGILRENLEPVLVAFRTKLDPNVRLFRYQRDSLLNDIYRELVDGIQKKNTGTGYYSVIADMLRSTEEEERWIFMWLAPTILKNVARRGGGPPPPRINYAASAAGPSTSPSQGPGFENRRTALTIHDLIHATTEPDPDPENVTHPSNP